MTKIIIYLIIISLLLPASVGASGQSATIPSSITSPSATSLNVELVGTWPVAEVVDLYVYGNQAYVAHHINRWDPETDAILSILDIFDPENPTEIDRIEGPYADSYQVVYADANYIYTAEDYSNYPAIQIQAYQQSDTANYVCWKKFDYYSKAIEMWSHSGYWLFVDANLLDHTGNGLQVFKPVPTEPYDHCEFVSSYEITGKVTAATYDDQYAYIGTADGSLWILDFTDPKLPKKVSQTPYGSLPIDAIAAASGYVYLAHGTEIKIIDVSDPASPGAAQSFTSPVEVAQLGAQGGYLYTTFEDGLYVYDVRDSSAPLQAGYYLDYDEEGFGSALHLANDLVFTGDLDDMNILRFTGSERSAVILEALGPGIVVDGIPVSSSCELPSLPTGGELHSITEDCKEIKSGSEVKFKFPNTPFGLYLKCFIASYSEIKQMGMFISKGKYEDLVIFFSTVDAHNACKHHIPTSSLGTTSETLIIDHISGELRYSFMLENLSVEVGTDATTLQSNGINDFSVAHNQVANQTTVRCYNGSVILVPENPTLPPIALSSGEQVEITSDSVSPITEIIYQTFVPLIVNQGPTNSASGLIMEMKELFESLFSNP
jgi:hypothetical protein